MTRAEVPSYPVSIFIAGSFAVAVDACRAYCDEVGLCVTITGTLYAYTGGMESGVVVGLINYGRFPSDPEQIFARAEALALKLIAALGQESATIQAPDKTVWLSFREADRDSGIEARLGRDGNEDSRLDAKRESPGDAKRQSP